MRKFIFTLIGLSLLVGCVKSDKYTDLKNKYDILLSKDSISQNENDFLINGLKELQEMDSIKSDSIAKLNNIIDSLKAKPMMSQEQFLKLYKYESLYKYYRIVVNNPSQKKFFCGWSKRTFEKWK